MTGAERTPRPASRFTLDWMLAVVILIAMFLAAGVWIRTTSDPVVSQAQSGLRALAPEEQLIAFEDYSYDAGAWLAASTDQSDATLGGILGPFDPNMALRRTIDLPAQHDQLILLVDVIPLGGGPAPELVVETMGEVAINRLGGDPQLGRIRVSIVIDGPAAPAELTISAPGSDGPWALDNLTIVSTQSAESSS